MPRSIVFAPVIVTEITLKTCPFSAITSSPTTSEPAPFSFIEFSFSFSIFLSSNSHFLFQEERSDRERAHREHDLRDGLQGLERRASERNVPVRLVHVHGDARHGRRPRVL